MVLMIIAAIAIPNLVHGKMRANEAAAVASVKTINTAEYMYHDAYPDVGYSSSLAKLGSNGSSCQVWPGCWNTPHPDRPRGTCIPRC